MESVRLCIRGGHRFMTRSTRAMKLLSTPQTGRYLFCRVSSPCDTVRRRCCVGAPRPPASADSGTELIGRLGHDDPTASRTWVSPNVEGDRRSEPTADSAVRPSLSRGLCRWWYQPDQPPKHSGHRPHSATFTKPPTPGLGVKGACSQNCHSDECGVAVNGRCTPHVGDACRPLGTCRSEQPTTGRVTTEPNAYGHRDSSPW